MACFCIRADRNCEKCKSWNNDVVVPTIYTKIETAEPK